jgi:hypothetical protein
MLILFQSCSKQSENLKYFGFRIENENSIVNSFDSTYTRRYSERDSTIKLVFSKAEMKLIFNEFIKNGMNNLPKNFEPYFPIFRLPSFETKLQIEMNKRKIELKYCSSCNFNILDTNDKNRVCNIEKSIGFIRSIVNSKEEVRNLPRTYLIFE